MARRHIIAIAAVSAMSLLAACTSATGTDSSVSGDTQASDANAGGATKESIVVLSHESFDFPAETLSKFTEATGVGVTIQSLGDGGSLTNQMLLSKDMPLGDVVYGVDNTVAYRLIGQGVIADMGIPSPNAELSIAEEPGLIPIDQGDVCINIDKTWFDSHNLAYPETYEDLVRPEYKDLLVAMNPATSSTGMAFMLGTINHFGLDGWMEYWAALKANGLKVTEGWSDAFAVDYSAGEGAGPRPMMVSYGSSPAYSVNEAGTETTTASLPATCYRQIEYAGILAGSGKEEAAKKFVEFLLTVEAQEVISELTYMYPTVEGAKAPEFLTTFGPLSDTPVVLPSEQIAEMGADWLEMWRVSAIG